jgi:predicted nucleotidyltransferase
MRLFTDTRGIRRRPQRPHGTLPENNLVGEMTAEAERYADKLSGGGDVVAITLGGGLSRGYGDALSEIDLNVYLDEARIRDWRMGKGLIPHGDHLGDRYHMDVSFLTLGEERASKWSLLKKWDASYQRVLHDPTGAISELLNEKDVFTAGEKHSLATRGYLDCTYHGDIVVRQWSLRGDPLVANQMISRGVPALCNLLFLANDEYPPFEKWLLNYSHSLGWKPSDWRRRVEEITIIKEPGFEEVERRSAAFMELYHEVWGRVVGEEYSHMGLLELDALEALEYVVESRPTVREFNERYGEATLGHEVLSKLAYIVEEHGAERVVFNRGRFLEEKASGFPGFLGWNREMLNHLRLR